jgi:uncharacterized protein (TIGR00369 family)
VNRESEVKILARMNREFASYIPHNKELGIETIELGDARAKFKLPYDPKLVGNPETGVLHGGAITALLDACSGASVFMALSMPTNIATLDLRIDYLRPAKPNEPVFAEAHCYRTTKSVAFVRAVAYHDSPDDPIAAAASTFMLDTPMSRETK